MEVSAIVIFLDFEVNYSYIDGDYLYAASASAGLFRGKLTDNLLDKKKLDQNRGLYKGYGRLSKRIRLKL